MRAYQPQILFQYSHDQDLLGWFVRDVVVNHHLRLIGQETSSHGIFIGPFFYYLQTPFYVFNHMDPSAAVILPIILGTFAVFSIYFILTKIFNKNVGLMAALIYATSVLIVFTDREVVPTMPLMLWTIWYLYSLWLILKNKKYGYILAGLLIGLIWSINLQLVILLPLVLVAQILSKHKINVKQLFVGILVGVILNIPFVAFEFRHGFQQTKALVSSLTTNKDYVPGTALAFLPKLDRTMQLVFKNVTNIFWSDNPFNISIQLTFWILFIVFIILIWKKKISAQLGIILFLWQIIYILFFTKLPLNISEYYLNGMNIIWILVFAVALSLVGRKVAIPVLGLFVVLNFYSFFTRPVNANGYLQRKAIITEIKKDAQIHNFPCVSLSFITSPGNNLGYRYFTWELGLKTKPVSDNIPVYSIVFPLSSVKSFDKSFGSLGLILPDYKRYNQNTINRSCEGDDYTLTEPMFGFTN